MYTATWPKEVQKIAADLLVSPVQVNIGNVNELFANKSITQNVKIVSPMEKQRRVEQIVIPQEPGSKIIIFCFTKKMCDHLTQSLSRQFGTAAIYGDKYQGERDYVLNQFRTGRCPVLVADAAKSFDKFSLGVANLMAWDVIWCQDLFVILNSLRFDGEEILADGVCSAPPFQETQKAYPSSSSMEKHSDIANAHHLRHLHYRNSPTRSFLRHWTLAIDQVQT
ncbi:hypothetical protein AgCh_022912 [Apium graveolens]